jgi:hypothetical protein
MDKNELVSKLQGLNEEWTKILRQHGAHEPDWGPLEKVLPMKWCGGFMFMGYVGKIRLYKHGLTRHYLNADPDGNTYLYDSEFDEYFRVPRKRAIKTVFAGLEEMGYKRTTKCTPEVMAERRRRMEEAGYTVVVMKPEDA